MKPLQPLHCRHFSLYSCNPVGTDAYNKKHHPHPSTMRSLYRYIPLIILLIGISLTCNKVISNRLSGANVSLNAQQESVLDQIAPAPTPEQIYDSLYAAAKRQKIDSVMQYANRRLGFHGAALASKDGKLLYSGAVGTADFATGDELSTSHVFQLASVSKQFTAMCIMILQEQGKLAYDDLLTDYIPNIPYKDVTIRHLLNHTAGLPNYMWLIEHKWPHEHHPYNDDVIAMLEHHNLPRYFSAGRRFDYSNTGYMLLASVVEIVSGKRFDDFMAEQIFQPLGMNESFVFCTGLGKPEPKHVTGYYHRWRRYREYGEDPNNGTVGDKNVFSTVHDLFLWDQALNDHKLVSQATLNEAFGPGKTRRHREIPYGFGFRLKQNHQENLVYHNGLWNGFRTAFVKDLNDGTTIILLNHTNSQAKTTVLKKLQNILKEPEDIQLEESPKGNDIIAQVQ